jgi:hypothetical protein
MASITGIVAPNPVQENTNGSPITLNNVVKDDFFVIIASAGGTEMRPNIALSGVPVETLVDTTATPTLPRVAHDVLLVLVGLAVVEILLAVVLLERLLPLVLGLVLRLLRVLLLLPVPIRARGPGAGTLGARPGRWRPHGDGLAPQWEYLTVYGLPLPGTGPERSRQGH